MTQRDDNGQLVIRTFLVTADTLPEAITRAIRSDAFQCHKSAMIIDIRKSAVGDLWNVDIVYDDEGYVISPNLP